MQLQFLIDPLSSDETKKNKPSGNIELASHREYVKEVDLNDIQSMRDEEDIDMNSI